MMCSALLHQLFSTIIIVLLWFSGARRTALASLVGLTALHVLGTYFLFHKLWSVITVDVVCLRSGCLLSLCTGHVAFANCLPIALNYSVKCVTLHSASSPKYIVTNNVYCYIDMSLTEY